MQAKFRVFAMSDNGALFHLGIKCWVMQGTRGRPSMEVVREWQTIGAAREFLREHFVTALPNGTIIADSYIAAVTVGGQILKTYPYTAKSEV